jgi:hypothetical protein
MQPAKAADATSVVKTIRTVLITVTSLLPAFDDEGEGAGP